MDPRQAPPGPPPGAHDKRKDTLMHETHHELHHPPQPVEPVPPPVPHAHIPFGPSEDLQQRQLARQFLESPFQEADEFLRHEMSKAAPGQLPSEEILREHLERGLTLLRAAGDHELSDLARTKLVSKAPMPPNKETRLALAYLDSAYESQVKFVTEETAIVHSIYSMDKKVASLRVALARGLQTMRKRTDLNESLSKRARDKLFAKKNNSQWHREVHQCGNMMSREASIAAAFLNSKFSLQVEFVRVNKDNLIAEYGEMTEGSLRVFLTRGLQLLRKNESLQEGLSEEAKNKLYAKSPKSKWLPEEPSVKESSRETRIAVMFLESKYSNQSEFVRECHEKLQELFGGLSSASFMDILSRGMWLLRQDPKTQGALPDQLCSKLISKASKAGLIGELQSVRPVPTHQPPHQPPHQAPHQVAVHQAQHPAHHQHPGHPQHHAHPAPHAQHAVPQQAVPQSVPTDVMPMHLRDH